MTVSAETRLRRERPLGVVLIAAFLALDALLVVADRFLGLDIGSRAQLIDDPEGRLEIVITLLLILRVVAAVGLWLGVRRAWVLTMLLVGLSLIVNLVLYWNGEAVYPRMAIDVVVALYLNQGAVRAFFESRPRAADAHQAATHPVEQ